MVNDNDDPAGKKAKELDHVIDEVLKTSRALVQQLEAMLDRARALVKENTRLLENRNKDKGKE